MSTSEYDHWLPPSSSPPSSPTAYNDSSPASSPGPEPVSLRDDVAPPRSEPLLDPFSASAKTWTPPDTEKGAKTRRASPTSPSRINAKKRRVLEPEASLETLVTRSPCVSFARSDAEREAGIWDMAVGRAIDQGNGTIDLSDLNLTAIPQKFIADLGRFHVLDEARASPVLPLAPPPAPLSRQFTRSSTAPAVLGGRVSGFSPRDIQLILASNRICRVPRELLHLEKLKVLSLRNNQLETLPPDIRYLINLHTLNVALNQLRYLPAEIMKLKLTNLSVNPNPFLELDPTRPARTQGRIAVSSVSRLLPRVPPLVELALRSLFSSDSTLGNTDNFAERRLEKHYELPLCEADERPGVSAKKEFRQVIPPHLRVILDAVHPGSVDFDDDAVPLDEPSSLGVCPSPHHGAGFQSVFVKPAEERYTWETVVAGANVNGGAVPLKWRGCSWGCLEFLGVGFEDGQRTTEMDTTESGAKADAVTRVQFDSSNGFVMDFDDDS